MRVLLLMILAVFSLSVSAQTITATGNVKDATGDPIIGASIVEKGNTSNGTITNLDGDFSLKVPANATLIVSYIGMKTQEIAIKGKNKIDVTLSDDTKALDEVVVIGYGTAKRKDITGSVATVSSEVLSAVPVASATEALQGKMAGVQITTTEGSPDAEMKIRVRGGGSITGDNTPLFIVDGFPVESISDIPASDIEDMTVLKDASSTAIYGSRGANGVILVTTKSGKEGKLSVSYNTYYSWKKMAKTLETLSATDYVKWQREYALLRGNESKFTSLFGNWQDADLYENAPTNDWQDQVFGRTGNTFNHSLTISGGSDKTKFNMGYAHMNDKAIMLGSSFRRDNLSLKLNHKVNDKVSLDFSMRYANTTVNGAGANESKSEVSSADSRMKNVMIYPMFNFPDLSDSYDPDFQLTNPITSVYDTDRKQNRQTFNMNGSFSWEIFKNFKFKTEFGLDWYYNTDKKYYGPSTYNARTNSSDTEGVHPMAYFADTQRKTFRNTNTVNYNFKDIIKNKDHNLNVLVGEETINKKSSLNDDRLSFFPVSFTASQAWALSSQGTPYSVDKYTNADDNLLSYFGRVNYDFQSKYLISGTFRADGSSKFSKGNRWGYFPSAAVAWRISSEKFMEKTQNWLDDLKIRFSYGKLGNQSTSDVYTYLEEIYTGGTLNYTLDGTSKLQYAYPSDPKTSYLTWETIATWNIGLDMSFLDSRLNFTGDYFIRDTEGMLGKSIVLPSVFGAKEPKENCADLRTKGWELSLGWNDSFALMGKRFNYTVLATLGDNLTEITKYNNSEKKLTDYYEGMKLGEIWGYRVDGLFASDEEAAEYTSKINQDFVNARILSDKVEPYYRAGDLKFRDLDGDNIISKGDDTAYDAGDREIIGNETPRYMYSFRLGADWNGIDLGIFFQGVGKRDWYPNYLSTGFWGPYSRAFTSFIPENFMDQCWSEENPGGYFPRFRGYQTFKDSQLGVNNDRYLQDASYIRLKNLTVGYTLPVLKKVFTKLRVYFTGENLWYWSPMKKYTKYIDPEAAGGNDNTGMAYNYSRNFSVGVDITF